MCLQITAPFAPELCTVPVCLQVGVPFAPEELASHGGMLAVLHRLEQELGHEQQARLPD